jgi:hypothetical protein
VAGKALEGSDLRDVLKIGVFTLEPVLQRLDLGQCFQELLLLPFSRKRVSKYLTDQFQSLSQGLPANYGLHGRKRMQCLQSLGRRSAAG